MKHLIALLLTLSIVACTSTTLIKSDPSGADVYLNGERIGVTPFSYSDRKMFGASNLISLRKEGYQEFVTVLSKDEEINYWAIAGGLLVFVPILWSMDYKPEHNYKMIPLR